ncbi:putative renalase, partial [Triplophysa rosa]
SRVLIVGAGLTGGICACLLRRELPNTFNIVVWDKSRGAGGRMSTSRSPSNPKCTVDLGAQYISATPYYARIHSSFYEELLAQDLLKPLVVPVEDMMYKEDGILNYVTPSGISSIVKHYLNKSVMGENQLKTLRAVSYSSRYALGLFNKAGVRIDVPWAAKYFSNNPCIRFIAIDNEKRNLASNDFGPSVVVHTSVPFGIQHLEKEKDAVQNIILEELEKVMPGLPQPDSIKCQKWRYSQVTRSVVDCPGQMTLLSQPLLVCGGDGFTHSNFDGCVESALKVFEILKSSL